jgi:hypothetical protein
LASDKEDRNERKEICHGNNPRESEILQWECEIKVGNSWTNGLPIVGFGREEQNVVKFSIFAK